MENSPQLPAGHWHNRLSIRLARHHASRQLVSRPEIQVGSESIEPSRIINNVIAAPVLTRPPTAPVPAAETRILPSPPVIAPLPVTPPTKTVPVLPHVVTPTPVIRIANAPQATATSVISTKTSAPLPPCSAGTSCMSTTAKVATLTSPMSQQTQSPQPFLASLSSSPGAIFFTCLAGIALIGIMLAILSCALRSWCNRRRRSNLDEDAWRFLENSKDFTDPSKDDEDELSFKGGHFRNDSQSTLAHLQPTLAKNYVASHPFPSHIQQQKQQHHYASFPIQEEQHMNGFIDEKGLGWIAPPIPVSSQYDGFLFAPCGPKTESMESYQRGYTLSDPVARKTIPAGSFFNRATMYSSPTQAPAATITRPVSAITRTSSTISNQQKRQHLLTREASLACSDQSTTVEELRERVADQRTDLRATLRGAIQKDKKAEDDLLESLISLWHDKTTESQRDSLRLQTPELPSKDHI